MIHSIHNISYRFIELFTAPRMGLAKANFLSIGTNLAPESQIYADTQRPNCKQCSER